MDRELLSTPTERISTAVWLLMTGGAFTATTLSQKVGLSDRGARYLLERLSTTLPLVRDDDGVWRLMPEGSDDGEMGA